MANEAVLGKDWPGKSSRSEQRPPQTQSTHIHTAMQWGAGSVTTATHPRGTEQTERRDSAGQGPPTQLLLLLLLLLVPPEVGLDGDGRLLRRVTEELALSAGIGGHTAWGDKQDIGGSNRPLQGTHRQEGGEPPARKHNPTASQGTSAGNRRQRKEPILPGSAKPSIYAALVPEDLSFPTFNHRV